MQVAFRGGLTVCIGIKSELKIRIKSDLAEYNSQCVSAIVLPGTSILF